MYNFALQTQSELKNRISQQYRADEASCIQNLINILEWDASEDGRIREIASLLVEKVRSRRIKGKGIDALMQEFKLSTLEGVSLMCLAESLLRIPDNYTQNQLIKDKLQDGAWLSHTHNANFFVNASSWGLAITGGLLKTPTKDTLSSSLLSTLAKWGEPVIRRAMTSAVRFMGDQFVMAESMARALETAVAMEARGYQFSYDMLGEAALTHEDAQKYMQSYVDAIHLVGKENSGRGVIKGPGISVKLSALHPRYTRSQRYRVMHELYPRLKHLILLAKQYQIGIFIDAEEAEYLEISLDLLEKLLLDKDILGFNGLGFVIQAYQRRAPAVIDYVIDLADKAGCRIMVRLVKGAYWDSEIKQSQLDGQLDYPVFTRKFYTDLSYLACARRLLSAQDQIYPAFATHNAFSVAAISVMGEGKEFEFQCLYGMGETLYESVLGRENLNISCRVYAPVGAYDTLLAYLVRRLLENGANSSFVHQLVDPSISIESLVANPLSLVERAAGKANPNLLKPGLIYPDGRINSRGIDLSDELILAQLEQELNKHAAKSYKAYSLLPDYAVADEGWSAVNNPAQLSQVVGQVQRATLAEVELALVNAQLAFPLWSGLAVSERARFILCFADLLEQNQAEIINLLVSEAGKTIKNALAEIREAVDFCRYYAQQISREFNNDTHQALGPIVCISPWNFPLAIFVGEVISALAAGNTVIVKPSDQANLIAFYAVSLMHAAGIPAGAVQLILGSGSIIGNQLTKDQRVAGVIFTGSVEVAQTINQNLATLAHPGILIAETGGQNTMIVDSTALAEQVVRDVIASGFDSAGQRCSALRVLYIQEDVADKVIKMLKGAMDELRVGNPRDLHTDVGPVIDARAQKNLQLHIENMQKSALMFYQTELSADCHVGTFVAPTIIEIGSQALLKREVFGPIIHIIRFAAADLEQVIGYINSSGYGLTQGLQSRLEDTAYKIYSKIKAGNIYINRNMVGAVVGVQPFGGEGLSGTGPKAGGPFYLYRLVQTKSLPQLELKPRTSSWAVLDNFTNNLAGMGLTLAEVNSLSELAQQLKQISLLQFEVELPGPTGERNFMIFAPRGYIACIGQTIYDYCEQVIYAFASGNQVILPKEELTQPLTNHLSKHSYFFSGEISEIELIHGLLISANHPQLARLRYELSQRDGLLTQVLVRQEHGYNHSLLLCERSVSINLTATGGNVQLMSMVDDI